MPVGRMTDRRIGFYPGTFDPVTFGHLDVIDRAAALFDHVVVGVAINDAKGPLLGFEERRELLEQEVAALPHKDRISVTGFDTLLVDAVRQAGAGTVIRGLRSAGDFDFETQLSGALRRLAPEIETVFLLASESHRTTASRIVKEIARLGGDISPFVSPMTARLVRAKLTGEQT
ncbi:pantetheine-phosphate adenylyltransferase [Parasaccharibacter sp. TMW2.1882]|uniref:Phosphopantetheine adenylyltransferase n=4 Tax=Acetobacterales TaxID=3120395 RepID=A0ABX4ZLW0_9PROT|nr:MULTISPECIES: pantetheine-phosphate adenylyltransferase [Acetobacteraceae]MCL1563157.1 pantetheine-phosphate adenylyltransferase [Parasaccharibacter sp. TMW 2.1886]MUG78743.1 pantetheine-phosphate adenylyltransferase [Bombella sp. ESL0380]QGT75820.1 pantetheine-phosphate adenylyltransferase [Bombella sp. ESL0368]MBA5727961.1 pantetheine-phosphate adenylyltransferase [Bombella mellum]MBE1724028.1 pantetheine-phosphate adenylyltransferase [Bombella apis]